MFVDDDEAQRPFDEHLDRESGVFVEPDAREVTCEPGAEPCAPDDYANDPDVRRSGIPGTLDDQPLSFGLDTPAAADEHVVLEGTTKPAGETLERADAVQDIGKADSDELWSEQSALVEEDEIAGLNLSGFPEEEVPEILGAMGDDAAESLPDFPNGGSATGDWASPDHGGFPERKD